jgi:FolB domain-containing protein
MIIKIKNLRVKALMGVYEFERAEKRELVLNLEIKTNAYKKGSDKLEDTLDYDSNIVQMLVKEIEGTSYQLIEKLADHLLNKLKEVKGVQRAKLEIEKPSCMQNVESVSVVVEG